MDQKYNLVVCRVQDCGYHSPSNFCLRPLTQITERGFCGYVYHKNSVNSNYTSAIDSQYKLNFGAERSQPRPQLVNKKIG